MALLSPTTDLMLAPEKEKTEKSCSRAMQFFYRTIVYTHTSITTQHIKNCIV